MKDLFKGCWTIPNLLSFIRILLIPVFAYLYYNDMKIEAVAVLAASGLSDMFDGKIARRFNQISALGKVLDPVADKLTQITIAVMLLIDFKSADNKMINAFGWVFLVFLIKEGVMIIGGLVMLLMNIRPGAAEIYGKVATTVFYVGMTLIIAIGPEVGALNELLGFQMPAVLTGIIVVISAIMTLVAFASYMPETFRQFKEHFDEKKAQKNSK
ncbi:MAG: CDP-alcohol phosphatidyltransferase family protein [Clostridia bacterium]|nr:CDP-alcohol phosphatidyltransferase family protein [Clostridia bacterium]MBR2418482.1 CDP-alcohol phosphatidyltransferase family protein [Clostridia bacterium]